MANRIFFGSLALILNSVTKNNVITDYFLSGVQSVGINSSIETVNIVNVGKTQNYDTLRISPSNEISIERYLSNRDIFWLELSSNYLYSTSRNSFNYGNTFFLKPEIFGLKLSGWESADANVVKSKNIPEYSFTMLATDETSLLDEMTGNSGVAQDIVSLPNCLLTSLSYQLSTEGIFSETISLFNQTRKKLASNNFELDTITGLDNPVTAPVLLKRGQVYNNLSVFPSSITALTDFNNFFNGQEIFGIKDIQIQLSLEYLDSFETGNRQQGEKVNWHKSIALPITVECSFTISARKLPQVDIDPINSAFLNTNDNQRICIVAGIPVGDGNIKFFIWNLGSKNKITSFNQTGGSTDGSIVEYEITYRNNNNDFLTYTQIQASDLSLNPPLFEQASEKY